MKTATDLLSQAACNCHFDPIQTQTDSWLSLIDILLLSWHKFALKWQLSVSGHRPGPVYKLTAHSHNNFGYTTVSPASVFLSLTALHFLTSPWL